MKTKKTQYLIITIIALLVIIIGSIYYYKYNPASTDTEDVAAPATTGSTIDISSFSNDGTPESSTTTTPYIASIEITTEYPQFGNLSSSTKFFDEKSALNTKLKSDAEALYNKGTDDLNKTLAALEEFHKEDPTHLKWTLVNDQRIYTEKNYINDDTGIFSYATKSYVDMAGAHGTFFYTSESYDLTSGNKIALDDLLQGDYKPFLLQYIKDKIASKSPDCLHCENLSSISDTVAQYLTFDNFVLSKDGITFLFSAYDLGAYAETASGDELFIPKDALREYMKRDW